MSGKIQGCYFFVDLVGSLSEADPIFYLMQFENFDSKDYVVGGSTV